MTRAAAIISPAEHVWIFAAVVGGIIIGVVLLALIVHWAVRNAIGRGIGWCVLICVVASAANAQRKPGQRIPSPKPLPAVLCSVDDPKWHYNGPGQDGSSKYDVHGRATLDCRDPNGVLMTSIGRVQEGGFLFNCTPGSVLMCDEPKITVAVLVTIGIWKPSRQPTQIGRRRASGPPIAPMVIPVGEELRALPPPRMLNFMATSFPGVYIVITDGKVWFIRERQGLPVIAPFRVVWP